MRAISIKQPWASRIVSGEKTLEVRSWSTRHRGSLLICASASPDRKRGQRWLTGDEPRGLAVGIVSVVGVREGLASDAVAALVDPSGYLVWELAHPVMLVTPFAVKGRLGFFDVPDALVQAAMRRSA